MSRRVPQASMTVWACVVIATHDDMLSESCDETFDVEEHSTNRRRLDLEQYLNTLQHQ
ncbi:MAG: hypothetical protein SOI66_09685 [Bifidobacterium sp.]|jgi:ABC-type lipoprotein export system ATPase subunit